MNQEAICELKNNEVSDASVMALVPIVSAYMLTYNHAQYIEQAIKGILQQSIDFPFELVIGEDCSTDGTREIVFEYQKKYPNIIRVITSDNNIGMMNNSTRTLQACRGKYIAFCEGDDYWIDPLKLQKQVDFLEANVEYGLCCTDFNIFWQTQQKMDKAQFKTNPSRFPILTNVEDFLEREGYMAPCTWVGRNNLFKNNNLDENCVDGTYAIMLDILATSKVHVIPQVTAVYRYLDESASHTKSITKAFIRYKGLFEIQNKYIEKYNLSLELKNKVKLNFYNKITDLIITSKGSVESEFFIGLLKEDPQNLINVLIFRINFYENKFLEIRNSKKYRLGHFVLQPIKKLFHLVK